MRIRDARTAECTSCERRFDLNFPKRAKLYQDLHSLAVIAIKGRSLNVLGLDHPFANGVVDEIAE